MIENTCEIFKIGGCENGCSKMAQCSHHNGKEGNIVEKLAMAMQKPVEEKTDKKKKSNGLYTSPICMTQQFRFCGNPFRIDTYKGCSFGCTYCFAGTRLAKNFDFNFKPADFRIIERAFHNAFETDKEFKDVNIEMLRNRVPLHLGGMADPFQPEEFEHKVTYKLLELTKKYNYPVMMSTKTAHLPEEYFDVLDPEIHAVQISILGWDADYVKKLEWNTPTPQERMNFVKELKSRGFWVSVRIQPLIDFEEAKKVVENLPKDLNYLTLEHMKIPVMNKPVKEYLQKFVNMDDYYKPKQGINYEMKTELKLKHFEELEKMVDCPVGAGDNDMHHMTQSRCCCGIDTVNKNFDNWLKYNTTYFMTGEVNPEEIWTPEKSVKHVFNSKSQVPGYTYKDYVDAFIEKHGLSNEKIAIAQEEF